MICVLTLAVGLLVGCAGSRSTSEPVAQPTVQEAVAVAPTPAATAAAAVTPATAPTARAAPTEPVARSLDAVPVTVSAQALLQPAACSGRFVAHALDHTTTAAGEVVRMFDSNGSGLAVNDLDNDGDLDLVLGNLAGPNAIFWNEGGLEFRKEPLEKGDTRAVAVVDVDGDGWQDIVFTHHVTPPTYARNLIGSRTRLDTPSFVERPLRGVNKLAYTMAWGDPDRDGDLDLVLGSYDLALQMALGDAFRFSSGAGVNYYEQRESNFIRHFLARRAQTLALLLVDVNGDGWLDILAGNDFTDPDYAWLNQQGAWQETAPFANTTQNTMSYDAGDINNDGAPELFATDMMPYTQDAQTLAAWKPVMDRMPHAMHEGDPQVMENVLQIPTADGQFQNQAVEAGVGATGWSWSSKFGDLDNDGFLDLYVVNGMQALDLFEHLPNNELVEENQAFRNDGGSRFLPAPEWQLNATEGGRGMSMADLDGDGDLDIVVNNLMQPAMIFENQLCGGASLEVDLSWPQSMNTRALGARVLLHTSSGVYSRDVRSSSGYLSGDPARLHFGFPADSTVHRLEVVWPDGAVSYVDSPAPATLLSITRTP